MKVVGCVLIGLLIWLVKIKWKAMIFRIGKEWLVGYGEENWLVLMSLVDGFRENCRMGFEVMVCCG